jgi:peroxiredoxin
LVRVLKVLAVIALVAVLVAGLATTTCCDGTDGNGQVPNGDTPNGDVNGNPNGEVPNGNEPTEPTEPEEPNGDEPEPAEPDLSSGLGLIIDFEDLAAEDIEIGGSLPDFTFQDANEQLFSLSDFKGSLVLLNFWRISCPWCVVEMPFIQQVYEQWPDEDVVILTINVGDSAEDVAEFMQDNEISLPVILDRETKLATNYMVSVFPLSFFIDAEGGFRGVWPGAFQSVEELENILEQLIAS